MNKLRIIILVICGFLMSCEKDKEIENPMDELDSLLIIGDDSANQINLDTIIYPQVRCDSILYKLDIDSNDVTDFQFYVYYCFSPCVYVSDMRIDCLAENCKILSTDSIQTPEILELGDTIQSNGNWIFKRINMLRTSGMSGMCDGDGIIYTSGNWHDLSNKYIGLKIKKEEYIILGWIKLSVNKMYNDYPIDLHGIGYKKAAYNKVYK